MNLLPTQNPRPSTGNPPGRPLRCLLLGLGLAVQTLGEPAEAPSYPEGPGLDWESAVSGKQQTTWPPVRLGTEGPIPPATVGIPRPMNSSPVDPSVPAVPRYSFKASGMDLKSALLLFGEVNRLNIVVDADVSGEVTVDVRGLALDQIMRALLEANDCWWDQEGGLVRVRTRQTRIHRVDYLRMSRRGMGHNSASLSAASSGGVGGGGSGSAGATGGVSARSEGGGSGGGSTINLSAENHIDFWKELRMDLERLLTPAGRETLAVNPTAGLIQISDRPSAQIRVERYLEGVGQTIRRQIDIEACLYDVTLSKQSQFGIDWEQAIQTSAGALTMGGAPSVVRPMGGFDIAPSSLNLTFTGSDTRVLLKMLQEQGEVRVISKPRLRTLNNQTALIKVGTETPFFQNVSTIVPGGGATPGASAVIAQDAVTSITVGTILAITPQVAEDNWVSLDVSPVLTSLLETRISPNKSTTAPVLDIKQASTLIRVQSGSTIVLGGLIQTETAKSRRRIPIFGDIPVLGRLFQGDFNAQRRKELVIFITPRVVR